MLDSTNWFGYVSAIALIGVSFAAVILAPQPPVPQGGASAGLPPIVPVKIEAGFMGTQRFGLWALICEDVKAGATSEPRRICRANTLKRVRTSDNQILLAAGFNVLLAGQEKSPAILFRLPPSANASDHVNFAIDDNPMFRAPVGRCSERECIVQGTLPAQALAQLKTGKVLTLIYTAKIDNQDRQIRVEQLLHGFPEAFEALTHAG